MSRLTSEQTATVTTWVAEGATLSMIQERIASQLGISMTYMDVRFLIDDLNLSLVEKEEPKKPDEIVSEPETTPNEVDASPTPPSAANTGRVVVEVDPIAQPHALVSGNVTFSDGEKADWYIDQQGRPGLAPHKPSYRPTQQDISDFQVKLDAALRQAGF